MYNRIIYILLFIILLILLLFIYKVSNKINKINKEKYIIDSFSNKYYSDFDVDIDIQDNKENTDYDCNDFFKSNSFCSVDDNKCHCNFQKDDLRYLFDIL